MADFADHDPATTETSLGDAYIDLGPADSTTTHPEGDGTRRGTGSGDDFGGTGEHIKLDAA